MRLNKLASTLVVTLALVLVFTGIGYSQAITFTDNVSIPTDIVVFVDCAAGGAGEEVLLTGDIHFVFHITEDASGGIHVQSIAQPQGISGYGLTTGDRYQGTGITRDSFHVSGLVEGLTYVNNFRIIGQGTGNNLTIHENVHIQVNAQGEVTAVVDNFSATCQ